MKTTEIKCPNCKSEEVIKQGTFGTKAYGKQQRFFCMKRDSKPKTLKDGKIQY